MRTLMRYGERVQRTLEQMRALSLDLLTQAVAREKSAADSVERRVILAKADGASWREIADALGTTPSNAHRKYADLAKEALDTPGE